MASQTRIPTLDFLRGFASLAVAWGHFTSNLSVAPMLKSSGTYGWVGVQVFFVISGFVIPYALSRSDYSLPNYGRFILKRIVRLDPPYLVSIMLILLLGYISPMVPGFRGQPFEVSPVGLLLHLGYVNVLFGYPWLNIVYWTLAIELQYYLLVGLIFPAVSTTSRTWPYLFLALAVLLSWLVSSQAYIFHFLPLFGMGILTFRYKTGAVGMREYLIALSLTFAAASLTLGLVMAPAGFATALLIAFVNLDNTIFRFFGAISYSLYLLHVPISAKIGNLAGRLPYVFPAQVVAPFAALFCSILAAYLLYKTVELPAQQWSSSIRYRKQRAQAVETASLETQALGEPLR